MSIFYDPIYKKTLKIGVIILFGLIAIFMIVENNKSKDLAPLGLSQQHTSENANKKNVFLLLHKTLDELSETWSENKIRPYRNAIKKFPNVDACLITPNDMNSINWSSIKTTTELEVCLSRIHSYLRDAHKSQVWFERQGFKVTIYNYPSDSLPYRRHRINANWLIPSSGPLQGQKSPMSGIRIFFEEFLAIAGISVGININQEGLVTHISAGYSRK